MNGAEQVKSELKRLAIPERAMALSRFFKTGKGEYGEGDVFLGVQVPQTRTVAKKYTSIPLADVEALLSSPIHEHRLAALLILIEKYKKADGAEEKEIYDFYISNTKMINNWDLVDLSAPNIVGEWLADKDRALLYILARSKNIWERRIAVLATFAFIRNRQFDDALRIAKLLLEDEHDLIHKAVGWMLREIGKRDQEIEERFLRKHAKRMPRTMLRYAIEKFDARRKASYMGK